VDKGCIFWIADECGESGKISIGENAYIGPYTFLGSCHLLEIGDNTLIGAHSYIITVNHQRKTLEKPIAEQGYRGAGIKIGKNVWIGAHVVILPSVEIGDGATIGAGAVVTKNIPSGETWVGVPAKHIK
jgi:acetyltransferase-like isoleucine patch superfamily enzyme